MQQDTSKIPTMRPASSGKSLVTLCTYQERQDKLRNTIVKDFNENQTNVKSQTNMREHKLPPVDYTDGHTSNYETINVQNGKSFNPPHTSQSMAKVARPECHTKPPNSPTPDYEHVVVRSSSPRQIYSNVQLRDDIASNVIGGNRRTMRLGTVTIGEYSQQQQREPGKFDFLEKKTSKDSNRFANTDGTTTLRAELQDTLSRSNLRKTTSFSLNDSYGGGRGENIYEHQKHCKLQNIDNGNSSNNSNNDITDSSSNNSNSHNNNNSSNKEYTNVEKLTRMLQNRQSTADLPCQRPMSTLTVRNPPMTSNQKVETYSNGILKNGSNSRTNRTSFSKTTEKSISFGN